MRPSLVPTLASAGMRIVDLGLESASVIQLNRMRKAPDPHKYLDQAKNLIRTLSENNIWVKINILLYSGETEETIAETIAWLDGLRNCIKGVSVSPVVVYGFGEIAEATLKEHEGNGASISKECNSIDQGVIELNLSPSITRAKAVELSKEISRRYMTDIDYFDLKSFSYFRRDFGWSEFIRSIESIPEYDLSFRKVISKSSD
jgi:hypothetical protein